MRGGYQVLLARILRGDTPAVREYLALSRWRRLGYRLYRHPLVMFGIGPVYLCILRHRLPFGLTREGPLPWISTMQPTARSRLSLPP
jgi:omega-6 fatty acid desaturase (delta-12 desaturase)